MLEGEDRLHQSEDSGTGLHVAEIGLGRCQSAGPVDAVNPSQALEFDWVTHWGTGAVGLDQANAGPVDAGRGQCGAIHRGLRLYRRRGDVDGVAVLVGGRSAHYGQNPIAVSLRIREPLE
ncbi:hypothetical protein DSM43518_00481 [Mycobacterium marinum]|uniref:Uncharacterized protein n=1 Tax=Mycobacterium marinum TaxID=1781 RepID=A0A3E2MUR8_MYCMR|nr:hypothetical protein DE4381_00004 [Mycobacterium marinum]RFZ15143.1 hypothetical protein DSM43518_00481 [Mycobacterium marinum]RFZ18376.1 hypothetical protein DSM43519_04194 [Mycobacterium marinum]RFZ18980.1 hypothetical protein VIMS_01311 [Mycobacterium marinum]RFZ23596.1 hypothetical protein DSM44344_03095 [Mycobacterium marinum]